MPPEQPSWGDLYCAVWDDQELLCVGHIISPYDLEREDHIPEIGAEDDPVTFCIVVQCRVVNDDVMASVVGVRSRSGSTTDPMWIEPDSAGELIGCTELQMHQARYLMSHYHDEGDIPNQLPQRTDHPVALQPVAAPTNPALDLSGLDFSSVGYPAQAQVPNAHGGLGSWLIAAAPQQTDVFSALQAALVAGSRQAISAIGQISTGLSGIPGGLSGIGSGGAALLGLSSDMHESVLSAQSGTVAQTLQPVAPTRPLVSAWDGTAELAPGHVIGCSSAGMPGVWLVVEGILSTTGLIGVVSVIDGRPRERDTQFIGTGSARSCAFQMNEARLLLARITMNEYWNRIHPDAQVDAPVTAPAPQPSPQRAFRRWNGTDLLQVGHICTIDSQVGGTVIGNDVRYVVVDIIGDTTMRVAQVVGRAGDLRLVNLVWRNPMFAVPLPTGDLTGPNEIFALMEHLPEGTMKWSDAAPQRIFRPWDGNEPLQVGHVVSSDLDGGSGPRYAVVEIGAQGTLLASAVKAVAIVREAGGELGLGAISWRRIERCHRLRRADSFNMEQITELAMAGLPDGTIKWPHVTSSVTNKIDEVAVRSKRKRRALVLTEPTPEPMPEPMPQLAEVVSAPPDTRSLLEPVYDRHGRSLVWHWDEGGSDEVIGYADGFRVRVREIGASWRIYLNDIGATWADVNSGTGNVGAGYPFMREALLQATALARKQPGQHGKFRRDASIVGEYVYKDPAEEGAFSDAQGRSLVWEKEENALAFSAVADGFLVSVSYNTDDSIISLNGTYVRRRDVESIALGDDRGLRFAAYADAAAARRAAASLVDIEGLVRFRRDPTIVGKYHHGNETARPVARPPATPPAPKPEPRRTIRLDAVPGTYTDWEDYE